MDAKEEDLIYKNLSSFQKFVRSSYFDSFILGIIAFNCVLLATDVPGNVRKSSIRCFVALLNIDSLIGYAIICRSS